MSRMIKITMRIAIHQELRESTALSAGQSTPLTFVLPNEVVQSSSDLRQPGLSAIHMRGKVFDHPGLRQKLSIVGAHTLCSPTSCPIRPACDARVLSVPEMSPSVLSCCRISV